jgi:hypothetical protein
MEMGKLQNYTAVIDCCFDSSLCVFCYVRGICIHIYNLICNIRPATSTQVFLGFPGSKSKGRDGSHLSKLPLHASHIALLT